MSDSRNDPHHYVHHLPEIEDTQWEGSPDGEQDTPRVVQDVNVGSIVDALVPGSVDDE